MNDATILLADDEETLRENLAQVLCDEGFKVFAYGDGKEALRALKNNPIDALITDLRMPGMTGMDLIDQAVKLAPGAPIIVITGFGEVETAVEAMKKGVRDYICKPLILDEVIFKLKRHLAQDVLAKENQVLRERLRHTTGPVEVIGVSPAMRAIRETIDRVANTMSNVLITGASGTGKEVIARAIHYAGITADKPFIAANCGGLADTLVESELFGYRKGAFTGANNDRAGYFEAADGGTLFLDEIANLPFHSQAILLRAIEQRAVTRVGDNRPRPVHIRLVAATNRDLLKAIEDDEFREDLYYRLNVIHITIPPLRERPEDIPLLMEHFLAKYNAELNTRCPGFAPEAMEAVLRHPWRGNVRELENVVERALIFANGEPVSAEDLCLSAAQLDEHQPVTMDLREATREFESRHIARVLGGVKGNKADAARLLGIGLSSLYRKLDELEIKNETAAASAS